ncbi:MAG: hypothetical protein ACO3JL_16555, partial [Myxococcota bacterium]
AAMREARAELAAARDDIVAARRQRQRTGLSGVPPELGDARLSASIAAVQEVPRGPARQVEWLRLCASLPAASADGAPALTRLVPSTTTTVSQVAQTMPQAGLTEDLVRALGGGRPEEDATSTADQGLARMAQLLALSGAS